MHTYSFMGSRIRDSAAAVHEAAVIYSGIHAQERSRKGLYAGT